MPVDAIKKLAEIIAVEKRHSCSDNNVELQERQRSAVLKHVLIGGVGDDVVAVQLDKIGFADKVFINGHKARKACDAVIFCQFDDEGYILILDMKSSIPSDENHIPQLVSGAIASSGLLDTQL